MFVTNLFVANMFATLTGMATDPNPRRSRRERPAKPALTRAGIVEVAMSVLRAEGLDRVTMRRLAQELDTGPASLYVYVRNTAELHGAILDELLGSVTAPADGDWPDRLVDLLTTYTEALFQHPALARSALTAWPDGPHYQRLVETVLALLAEGGVPPAQAAWGVDLLLLFGTATAAEQATRDEPANAAAARADWAALAHTLDHADPNTHPQLAALGPALLSGAPEQRLAWGLRTLINGIRHTPVPPTSEEHR
jgi:AcrR family transcriptional regulator